MKPEFGFSKVEQYGQTKSDASGSEPQKPIANKVVRRWPRRDTEQFDRNYRP